MPAGQIPDTATVALPPPPKIAGNPLILSFEAIFVKAIPPVAELTVPLSVKGSTAGGSTVMVSVAVAHKSGPNVHVAGTLGIISHTR